MISHQPFNGAARKKAFSRSAKVITEGNYRRSTRCPTTPPVALSLLSPLPAPPGSHVRDFPKSGFKRLSVFPPSPSPVAPPRTSQNLPRFQIRSGTSRGVPNGSGPLQPTRQNKLRQPHPPSQRVFNMIREQTIDRVRLIPRQPRQPMRAPITPRQAQDCLHHP